MTARYTLEKIENWVSDFVMGDGVRGFPGALREIAGDVLVQFLTAACDARDVDPADVEEADFKRRLESMARLNVPADVRPQVPALCGALLAQLEADGRLSGGRLLGAYVKALTPAYVDAASGKVKPITNAGAKIGRNEPCPCGSGKKYKKCCG